MRHEKQQNEDKKEMLKEAMKQNKEYMDKMSAMENRISDLTAENEVLKQNKSMETDQDNQRLREIVKEEAKETKKMKERLEKEITRLQSEKMETLEKLRCTVLGKEKHKETERVLLNTFDMMKKYVDENAKRDEHTR